MAVDSISERTERGNPRGEGFRTARLEAGKGDRLHSGLCDAVALISIKKVACFQ